MNQTIELDIPKTAAGRARRVKMKNFSESWKTTLAGVVTIIVGIASLFGIHAGDAPIDANSSVAMITGGLGLLFAKDGDVTK